MYEAGVGGLFGDYVAEFESVVEGVGGLEAVEEVGIVFKQFVCASHLFREERVLSFYMFHDDDHGFLLALF